MHFLANDDKFQDIAQDILDEESLIGPVWVKSFFRAAARRALCIAETKNMEIYKGDSSYGAF